MKRIALIAFLALIAAACGETTGGEERSGTGGTGLAGVDLEPHCRAWCEPETGCSDVQTTPVRCLENCLADAERDTCFEHVVTYQECMLAMECTDPFEDCEAPGGLPRMAPDEDPMCEVFDNAYARCTCENLPQSGAGGAGGTAGSRTAAQVCDDICSLPDECLDQFGFPLQGADCVQTCEAQAEYVGIDCLNAISSTIACLGTCDLDQVTEAQAAECQDQALGISATCD